MHPTHHLERSQRYLNFVPDNVAAGDYFRAANALARSASHAVTAAAVHWSRPHHTRRRLTTILTELVYTRSVAYTHLRTFTQVYRLLQQVPDAAAADARRMLRRLRRRVSRFTAAVAGAISDDPAPLSFEDLIADPSNRPEPEPAPQITTIGELREILGIPCDTAYKNHPIECPGCRLGYNDPNVPHIQ